MSLSERDLQVLAELEHDLGRPSAGTRLYLLIRAARSAWHGLLLPVVVLAAGPACSPPESWPARPLAASPAS